MKRLRRIFVVATAGAALAHFLNTPRGHALRARAMDLLRRCYATRDCSCGTCAPQDGGSTEGAAGANDPAVQAKIDETRRRLREQLKETLGTTPPVDTDRPPTETTA